jgi:DNA adenine methylase
MTDAKPFLKWVGGKRQLLPALLPHLRALGAPQGKWTGRFHEPFLGGGAVFFALAQDPGFQANLNDFNPELANLYRVVQSQPDALHAQLQDPMFANTVADHAMIRSWDRLPGWPAARTDIERAARFVYLNRTSFNGLWRVNSKGHFNVPFGRYKTPGFPSQDLLRACSAALQKATLNEGDFEACLTGVQPGDVVYLDPPYIPVSASSSFTGYTKAGFDAGMQERLAQLCDRLTAQGVHWVLSNADVPEAHALFGRQPGSVVHVVQATRSINRNANGRGPVGEIIAVSRPTLAPGASSGVVPPAQNPAEPADDEVV